MDVSIVIPVYNEEESIQELTDWIVRVCSSRIISFEIIYVDDGSSDSSWDIIQSMGEKNQKELWQSCCSSHRICQSFRRCCHYDGFGPAG
jgi:glycosyltransferase involved in cell wall biosynthesis